MRRHNDYGAKIVKAMLFMQRNLETNPSLDEVAQEASLSPYHFHRIFRGYVGEPVAEHMRRLRLERAAFALVYSRLTVLEIALSVGYGSSEAFSRAFKGRYALTPAAYRQAGREDRAGLQMAMSVYNAINTASAVLQESYMEVEFKSLAPIRVLFIRHIGPYQQCGDAWGRMCAWLQAGGHRNKATRHLGLGWDDPEVTPPERLRYDACVELPQDVRPTGEVTEQIIEGGVYAVALHKGPYSGLFAVYAELCGRVIPSAGRTIRHAPGYEVYLNDPSVTAPEELLTLVHIPVDD